MITLLFATLRTLGFTLERAISAYRQNLYSKRAAIMASQTDDKWRSVASQASVPSDSSPNNIDQQSTNGSDGKLPLETNTDVPGLASKETQRMEAAMGDAILRFLRVRKGPKPNEYDLDAVSVWRSSLHLKGH